MPRPKKQTETQQAKKKGRASWKPAARLAQYNVGKEYVPRWVDKDPANIEKKLAEGWEFVHNDDLPQEQRDITGKEQHPEGEIADGKSLSTARSYRELVLMRLLKDIKEERDQYYKAKTDRQTAAVKQKAQEELDNLAQQHGAPRANVHGKIVIE